MVDFEGAGPLLQRMAKLGLDPDAVVRVEPGLFGDLVKRCANCESRDVCAADLRCHRFDRGQIDYCANSILLGVMTEVWWFRELL